MLRVSLLCVLTALWACGPLDESGSSAATLSAPAPSLAAAAMTPTAHPDDALAGLWWIFAPQFPIRAFRMNLQAIDGEQTRTGTWVSFDWRGTGDPETLLRLSKPVRIEARNDGQLLILEGPTPMLMESGQPNGHSGRWRLQLRRSDLPGEPVRWSGTAVHGTVTGPDGVPVDMVRDFRAWQSG